MQGLVRPLVYVVIGYGIGGPQLLGLSHKEVKVRLERKREKGERESHGGVFLTRGSFFFVLLSRKLL